MARRKPARIRARRASVPGGRGRRLRRRPSSVGKRTVRRPLREEERSLRGLRPHGRHVVLGITGSIAAYKAPEIVRGLVKAKAEVRCVLSHNASHFVTPLTLSVLSRNRVSQDAFDRAEWDLAHISLASWAELILIAPATADFIARLAQGRAEGLLDSLALAAECPIAVCPAMDVVMWKHPATQRNVGIIRGHGTLVWGPGRGEMASGKVGEGRLLEPSEIVSRCLR